MQHLGVTQPCMPTWCNCWPFAMQLMQHDDRQVADSYVQRQKGHLSACLHEPGTLLQWSLCQKDMLSTWCAIKQAVVSVAFTTAGRPEQPTRSHGSDHVQCLHSSPRARKLSSRSIQPWPGFSFTHSPAASAVMSSCWVAQLNSPAAAAAAAAAPPPVWQAGVPTSTGQHRLLREGIQSSVAS